MEFVILFFAIIGFLAVGYVVGSYGMRRKWFDRNVDDEFRKDGDNWLRGGGWDLDEWGRRRREKSYDDDDPRSSIS